MREQSARLTVIDAWLGSIELRLDIWKQRMARIEARLQLRKAHS
jgi:hypothetical protein